MTGGYISIKDEVLNPVSQDVPGSFEYAKSLISANKPIFGVMMIADAKDNEYPGTYTGCVVQTSPTNIRIILNATAFKANDYSPDTITTVINIGSNDVVE